MDKEEVARVYNEILLGHKKNEILSSAATWMDVEGSILNMSDNDKYHIILIICPFTYSKNLNTKQNEQTKQKFSTSQ